MIVLFVQWSDKKLKWRHSDVLYKGCLVEDYLCFSLLLFWCWKMIIAFWVMQLWTFTCTTFSHRTFASADLDDWCRECEKQDGDCLELIILVLIQHDSIKDSLSAFKEYYIKKIIIKFLRQNSLIPGPKISINIKFPFITWDI